MFNEIGLDPATLYPHVIDRPAAIHDVDQCDPRGIFVNEEQEELYDALSPVYDQLRIGRHWWALELVPQKRKYQRVDGTWAKYIGYVARFAFGIRVGS